MSNKEKYKKIFIESLDFDEKLFKEELKYQEIEEWDSIGHMGLVSADFVLAPCHLRLHYSLHRM